MRPAQPITVAGAAARLTRVACAVRKTGSRAGDASRSREKRALKLVSALAALSCDLRANRATSPPVPPATPAAAVMARRVSGATSGWVTAAARTSTPADSAAMPTVARPAPTLAPTPRAAAAPAPVAAAAREAASAAAAAGIARTPTPTRSAAVEA